MYMSMNFFILFAFISTFYALLLATVSLKNVFKSRPIWLVCDIKMPKGHAIIYEMTCLLFSFQCVYNAVFAYLCSVYMFFVRCILNFFSFFHMPIEPVFFLTYWTAYPMYDPMLLIPIQSKFMYAVERFINLVIFDTNDWGDIYVWMDNLSVSLPE